MPFRECSIMVQREAFCRAAAADEGSVSALCRSFGISRTTGYKWLERWRKDGAVGLNDRSRRPQASPFQTSEALASAVLAVRAAHPCWGGRKIRRVLERNGVEAVPAASTITAILRRAGLLDGPRAGQARAFVRFEHAAPNDLWQMDFKGHVPLGRPITGGRSPRAGAPAGERRCHPLTVLDDHSRYALELGACADERGLTVRQRLERVFHQHGRPVRILADNGSPWGTAGSGSSHTPLTVWLLDLDIAVIHGRPYHPQTQGKDERFHRTLGEEVLTGRSFADLDAVQRAFDAWRHVYNTERPHEALGLMPPAARYRPSPRPMPQRIAPPEYDLTDQVRSIGTAGQFSFKGQLHRCSQAFAGRRVALRATDVDGLYDLCYRRHVLAQIDLRQNVAKPVHHVSEQVSTLTPV
jgi:transposase InsO family protein